MSKNTIDVAMQIIKNQNLQNCHPVKVEIRVIGE